jgi:uncharacterized protein (TIGR03000 family)
MMMMKRFKSLTMAIMSLAIVVLVFSSDAQAWGWGGSCGSWGGYGRGGWHGRGVRNGSFGSYGSYGSYGRRVYRRVSYGGRGYYGGRSYYGGRAYYGGRGYYGGYGFGRATGPVRRVISQPVTHVASATTQGAPRPDGRAAVAVNVPDNAIVYVNGDRTKSTGQRRLFLSAVLKGDQAARFEVRAAIEKDGQTTEKTQVVTVAPGRTRELSFHLTADTLAQTALVLHVPADAIVQIDGRKIETTGPRRVLTTQRLPIGKKVDDLHVQVTLVRDGTTLSKEQNVTLRGGQETELTFEFDATAVALR